MAARATWGEMEGDGTWECPLVRFYSIYIKVLPRKVEMGLSIYHMRVILKSIFFKSNP